MYLVEVKLPDKLLSAMKITFISKKMAIIYLE